MKIAIRIAHVTSERQEEQNIFKCETENVKDIFWSITAPQRDRFLRISSLS